MTLALKQTNRPEETDMTYQYRVVRPNAGIVSQHRSISRAIDSLEKQRRGSRQQGGYCQDYIEKFTDSGWRYWHEPPADGRPINPHSNSLGRRRI